VPGRNPARLDHRRVGVAGEEQNHVGNRANAASTILHLAARAAGMKLGEPLGIAMLERGDADLGENRATSGRSFRCSRPWTPAPMIVATFASAAGEDADREGRLRRRCGSRVM